MTFKVDDRLREVSTTTGTGTYTLGGAVAGFRAFSVLGANNYTRYFATDGVDSEWGIGRYLSGPDRLERTTIHGSTNAGAAVNWGVGSRTLRCGPIASMDVPRNLSLSVAGGAGTTVLTQDQQRRDSIEFTGALTGNRIIEVDDTPWGWLVYNNTTGAFTLTVRVTGQTGVALAQGERHHVYCDSTDVRLREYSNGEYRSVQVFTAGGTWNKPAGLKRVKVTVVGGGGQGGGSGTTGAGQVSAGAGGSAGGTSIKTIAAASLGSTETVTIGAGGSTGTAGNNGQTGGTSSFGAHCSATGGGAGGSQSATNVDSPGGGLNTPGVGSGGDINIRGGSGGHGICYGTAGTWGVGGHGGASTHGGGAGTCLSNTANGAAGGDYGGGGSGAACGASVSARVGGLGAGGIVIVEEFF
jgi:hypothetical protein